MAAFAEVKLVGQDEVGVGFLAGRHMRIEGLFRVGQQCMIPFSGLPRDGIVVAIGHIISVLGVRELERGARSGMVGAKDHLPRTKIAPARDNLAKVGDKGLARGARMPFVRFPAITIVHSELDVKNVRRMRLDIVMHALQRHPGRVAVYGRVLDDDGNAITVDLLKSGRQPAYPDPVGRHALTEADGVPKKKYS